MDIGYGFNTRHDVAVQSRSQPHPVGYSDLRRMGLGVRLCVVAMVVVVDVGEKCLRGMEEPYFIL